LPTCVTPTGTDALALSDSGRCSPGRGEFRPNHEVDEIRWASIELVGDLLTYERDLVVVSGLRLVRVTVS
jgi:hypothetical protein